MAKLQISIPHQLPPQEAQDRIKNLLEETARNYGDRITNLQEQWHGRKGTFSFTASGFSVSGTLEVRDSTIVLDGTIPWTASLFKGKIESRIREEAGKLLGH